MNFGWLHKALQLDNEATTNQLVKCNQLAQELISCSFNPSLLFSYWYSLLLGLLRACSGSCPMSLFHSDLTMYDWLKGFLTVLKEWVDPMQTLQTLEASAESPHSSLADILWPLSPCFLSGSQKVCFLLASEAPWICVLCYLSLRKLSNQN